MAKKRNHIAKAILILAVALAIAGICRTFCVEFYRVAPAQMENTLLAGDRIYVDKLCYGIRLPQTISLLPFTDTIPFTSLPAYYPTRPLPYKRIKTKTAQRGDIVIYNYPTEQKYTHKQKPHSHIALHRHTGRHYRIRNRTITCQRPKHGTKPICHRRLPSCR